MDYVERTLSYLTKNQRGRDAKLFSKRPAFESFSEPTITVTSPDCGPTGSLFSVDHTADGKALIPTISWSLPESIPASSVAEYLVVIEDADVPLPSPVFHAGYYSILATKTEISQADLEKVGKQNELKGGFKYAKNLRSVVYVPPRPLRGHGPHSISILLLRWRRSWEMWVRRQRGTSWLRRSRGKFWDGVSGLALQRGSKCLWGLSGFNEIRMRIMSRVLERGSDKLDNERKN